MQHINYSVPDAAIRGQIVTLLTDVTGFIAPARMTALVSFIGAGAAVQYIQHLIVH